MDTSLIHTDCMGDAHIIIIHNALCLMADKYIPYTVMVRARTSAGYGAPASDIVFTEEGGKP